ncbi:hypothetical protein [Neisseria musculi]|uniref:hypothetical protein n=1 Tax=Neisseria musculi TaxID=1815583 RepID=UPI00164B137F|nr:hypothetical protein [Neisseria musculi]
MVSVAALLRLGSERTILSAVRAATEPILTRCVQPAAWQWKWIRNGESVGTIIRRRVADIAAGRADAVIVFTGWLLEVPFLFWFHYREAVFFS